MTHYVTAVAWEHGWELHIEGVGCTQVAVMAEAVDQVRDYMECETGQPCFDDVEFTYAPVALPRVFA